MTENDENESVIDYTENYGEITTKSEIWDDFEDFGENQLLNSKISKIKIYLGKFKGKDAIVGISFTFLNWLNRKEKVVEHKGSEDFIDVKELVIKQLNT